ncbi:MAG: GGDEF domain-containing protein [Planctomycetes bacterium]|nr:GGDEF domain-containing protein [Planctomycetota bacterium]
MATDDFFNVSEGLRDLIDRERRRDERARSGDERPDCSACLWPTLYGLSAHLASSTADVEETLRAIVDVAIHITRARRGLIILVDEGGGYRVRVARNHQREDLILPQVTYSTTIVRRAVEEREAVYVPSVEEDQGLKGQASVMSLELTSAMCAPLRLETPTLDPGRPARGRRSVQVRSIPEVLGCIYVDSNALTDPLSQEDLQFFRALANHATAALMAALLYEQATTDPLSRLYTRRLFELLLGEAIRRAEAEGLPFSLIMTDIDHFKRVNDTWGHPAGDEVIRRVAEAVRQNVRAVDACCSRYGGEEFAVIVQDADAASAQRLAERIRSQVERLVIHCTALDAGSAGPVGPQDVGVTISLGVATYPDHAADRDELVARSDESLYAAKHGGRNQVRVWGPELASAAHPEGRRTDRLAGLITGDGAADHRSVGGVLAVLEALDPRLPTEGLLGRVADRLVDATWAERAVVLLGPGAAARQVAASRGRGGGDLPAGDLDEEALAEAVREVRVVERTSPERVVRVLPLAGADGVLGAIYLEARPADTRLHEGPAAVLDLLGRQVALAVEHGRLRAASRVSP